MKRTNPAGKDSVHLSTSVPKVINREIKKMAKAAGLTRSGMARELLTEGVARITGKPNVGKVIIMAAPPASGVHYPQESPSKPELRVADDAGG